MSTWKINGTLAADLNVGSININRKSQDADECLLRVLAPFDANDLFANGAAVLITKDDQPYFHGRCESDPRRAEPAAEFNSVRLVGVYWYLQNRIFQQTWTQITNPATTPPTTVAVQTTYVILGMNSAGVRIASGVSIVEALNFCIASGAPFQLGTILDGALIPMDECTDLTCAEVIHRCLRWTPDAVTWVDESTTPPTLHIQRRSALTAVALSLMGANVTGADCEPCYSLQLDGVRLYFCVDSVFPSVIQTAGNPNSFRTLEQTIKLAGVQNNILLNKVEVEALPDDQNDATWWKGKFPWLGAPAITNLVLGNGDIGDMNGYGNMLKPGSTVTDWMKDHQNIHSAQCKATVRVSYSQGGSDCNEQVLCFDYTATDAVSKTYTWGDGGTPAEVPPEGLATTLYSACSQLHYKGQLTLVDEECGRGATLLGKVLNLTGGKAAWASMRALIVGVAEDVFRGRTTITFGPPPCLNSGDLMDLARANRIRLPAGHALAKQKGTASDADSSPGVGGPGGGNGGASGLPKFAKLQVTSTGDTPQTVTIDPADPSDTKFNLLFVTGYGADGMTLASIECQKRGSVLVITGTPTNLDTLQCGSAQT